MESAGGLLRPGIARQRFFCRRWSIRLCRNDQWFWRATLPRVDRRQSRRVPFSRSYLSGCLPAAWIVFYRRDARVERSVAPPDDQCAVVRRCDRPLSASRLSVIATAIFVDARSAGRYGVRALTRYAVATLDID